jgi:hypothetical protein
MEQIVKLKKEMKHRQHGSGGAAEANYRSDGAPDQTPARAAGQHHQW